MDIHAGDAYLDGMLARFIAMLAILAITVVTTVTTAHAARMSAGADHTVLAGEMISAGHHGEPFCDGEQQCGSVDSGTCDVVCAGLSAFLSSPVEEGRHEYALASHDLPSEAIHASRAPGLNERPPKLRLL